MTFLGYTCIMLKEISKNSCKTLSWPPTIFFGRYVVGVACQHVLCSDWSRFKFSRQNTVRQPISSCHLIYLSNVPSNDALKLGQQHNEIGSTDIHIRVGYTGICCNASNFGQKWRLFHSIYY